jgi:hypothetical protein
MLSVAIKDKIANHATLHVDEWECIQNKKPVITTSWTAFNAA